jgi:hypothetical protein
VRQALVARLVVGEVGALLEVGPDQRQQPVDRLLQLGAIAAETQWRQQDQQVRVMHRAFDLLVFVVDAAAARVLTQQSNSPRQWPMANSRRAAGPCAVSGFARRAHA